jgi:hypothetical protein
MPLYFLNPISLATDVELPPLADGQILTRAENDDHAYRIMEEQKDNVLRWMTIMTSFDWLSHCLYEVEVDELSLSEAAHTGSGNGSVYSVDTIKIIKAVDVKFSDELVMEKGRLHGRLRDIHDSWRLYKHGLLHTDDDTPSLHRGWTDPCTQWHRDGKLHRDNGLPASIESYKQEWYQHGKLHRDHDQPAQVWENGTQVWYKNGLQHRDGDQPALIHVAGTTAEGQVTLAWYKDGVLHREGDLPAMEFPDGSREWYIQGVLQKGLNQQGCQRWFRNDKLHRDGDLPAVTAVTFFGSDDQEWYKDGLRHRDGDLPAVINRNGQFWYQDGQLHRKGDQPSVIGSDGTRRWSQSGKLHRDGDQPAVVHANGDREWWQHGQRHRDGDQPAVVVPAP